jgi:hypothetical protein
MAAIDDLKSVMEGLLAEANSQGGTVMISREALLEIGVIVSNVEDEVIEEPIPLAMRGRPTVITSDASSTWGATFTLAPAVPYRRTAIREEDLPQFPVDEFPEDHITDSLRYTSARIRDLTGVTRYTRDAMQKLAAAVKASIKQKKVRKVKRGIRNPAKRAKKQFSLETKDTGISPRKVKCNA